MKCVALHYIGLKSNYRIFEWTFVSMLLHFQLADIENNNFCSWGSCSMLIVHSTNWICFIVQHRRLHIWNAIGNLKWCSCEWEGSVLNTIEHAHWTYYWLLFQVSIGFSCNNHRIFQFSILQSVFSIRMVCSLPGRKSNLIFHWINAINCFHCPLFDVICFCVFQSKHK